MTRKENNKSVALAQSKTERTLSHHCVSPLFLQTETYRNSLFTLLLLLVVLLNHGVHVVFHRTTCLCSYDCAVMVRLEFGNSKVKKTCINRNTYIVYSAREDIRVCIFISIFTPLQ